MIRMTLMTFALASVFSLAEAKDVKSPVSIDSKKIEIIKGKTQQKNMEMAKKNFHGKVITKNEIQKINSKSIEGNKYITSFLSVVTKTILSKKVDSKKLIKLKVVGSAKAKIQIQESGEFDVLFIEGSNAHLSAFTERLFEEIEKFPMIPKDAGQAELQIQIPILYNFSK
jgi:hypothetical protein